MTDVRVDCEEPTDSVGYVGTVVDEDGRAWDVVRAMNIARTADTEKYGAYYYRWVDRMTGVQGVGEWHEVLRLGTFTLAGPEREFERVTPPDQSRDDSVNHPSHYTSDPSGVECIQITRHRNFNVGNSIKYLWRAGLKDEPGRDAREKQIEDLRKAVWYIEDEIKLLERKGS